MTVRKPRTVGDAIQQARGDVKSLRKLLYPILSQRGTHRISETENLTGFWLLDALEQDLKTIEKKLGLPEIEE